MIKVTHLSKSYAHIKAVDNVSFEIAKGEVFGLLGPNGAGKSTILNIISTLLPGDEGTVVINKTTLNGNVNAAKQHIGMVPQEISLYEELSAFDNLWFWGNMYQIPHEELRQRIESTLKLIGLSDKKKQLIKTYSGGMKRRINIAAALLHKPPILLMDEPTVGIDPQSRNRIFEVIETLNDQGITIVYTTHYMEEVERLCDRIAIIDNGKIIARGTLQELKEQVPSRENIQLEFEWLSHDQIAALKTKLPYPITHNGNVLTIEASTKDLPPVISACNTLQLPLKDIQLQKVNLETIFLHLTGKQLRD